MNTVTIIIIAVVGIVLGYLLARQNFLNKNLGGRATRQNRQKCILYVIPLELAEILFPISNGIKNSNFQLMAHSDEPFV